MRALWAKRGGFFELQHLAVNGDSTQRVGRTAKVMAGTERLENDAGVERHGAGMNAGQPGCPVCGDGYSDVVQACCLEATGLSSPEIAHGRAADEGGG